MGVGGWNLLDRGSEEMTVLRWRGPGCSCLYYVKRFTRPDDGSGQKRGGLLISTIGRAVLTRTKIRRRVDLHQKHTAAHGDASLLFLFSAEKCRPASMHVDVISCCHATCLTVLPQVSTAVLVSFVSPSGNLHDKHPLIGRPPLIVFHDVLAQTTAPA